MLGSRLKHSANKEWLFYGVPNFYRPFIVIGLLNCRTICQTKIILEARKGLSRTWNSLRSAKDGSVEENYEKSVYAH